MTHSFAGRLFVPLVCAALFLAGVFWAYWTTLAEISWRWSNDPQYSHGYLVPLFALALLWLRRAQVAWRGGAVIPGASGGANAPVCAPGQRPGPLALKPSVWGIGLLALAAGMRLAGGYFHFGWLDQMSLLPCLAGMFVLLGGRAAWRWSWPAVAFLAFMVPLPHRVAVSMSAPMQRIATEASTFALQTLGRPALAEGNVILLNDVELGIVEACSGLRMLVVFFALSTAVALLLRKPLWERILVAGSALPIALVSNVIRITVTGVIYDMLGPETGQAVFHDLMGWLMMPLGLAFLGLELWLLNRLLLEPPPAAHTVTVTHQRVAMNPVALYRQENTRRRETAPAKTES
ncbi:MAG: exosortase/archaeosortase family protein [Gemmataceae bacterium]|nr:exosortase/archaeosortase family protein [Gemmataceae bacterium]MCI0739345.1 exosortase/archaeosortase family protein [Gemmataceae bacterium]